MLTNGYCEEMDGRGASAKSHEADAVSWHVLLTSGALVARSRPLILNGRKDINVRMPRPDHECVQTVAALEEHSFCRMRVKGQAYLPHSGGNEGFEHLVIQDFLEPKKAIVSISRRGDLHDDPLDLQGEAISMKCLEQCNLC